MTAVLILLAACTSLAGARLLYRRGSRWWPLLLAGWLLLALTGMLVAGAYEVRKLIGLCLMPTGLVWLALLAVAWWLGEQGRMRVAVVVWLLFAAFGLAGNSFLGSALVCWLERDFAAINPLQLPPFDAVMVLGGGVTEARHGQITLAESGDRVMLAARLYHAGKVSTLITSGPPLPYHQPTTSTPTLTTRLWQDLGVPAESIVQLVGPRTTSEEIVRLAELLQSRQWQRVGLITSGYHLRRAMRLCRRHGLVLQPLPANLLGRTASLQPRQLIPRGSGFSTVQLASWELLGAAAGR